MSRPRKLKMVAQVVNEIAQRAGWLLEQNHPGPHKDKRIATLLGVSPDMAGLLRRGRGWTADRLNQVWKLYGRDFVVVVFENKTAAMDRDLEIIKADLAHLKATLLGVLNDDFRRTATVPPMAGQEASALGGVARREGGVLESCPVQPADETGDGELGRPLDGDRR